LSPGQTNSSIGSRGKRGFTNGIKRAKTHCQSVATKKKNMGSTASEADGVEFGRYVRRENAKDKNKKNKDAVAGDSLGPEKHKAHIREQEVLKVRFEIQNEGEDR